MLFTSSVLKQHITAGVLLPAEGCILAADDGVGPGVNSQVRVGQGLNSEGCRFTFRYQSAVYFSQLLKTGPPPPQLHLLTQAHQVKGRLLAEQIVSYLGRQLYI